ncbi:MAG: segregation/condensation protein A [Acidobacteria bacterium]|nr:segregation/condensation protein A [Acidobacteriota bacterium]MCG2817021.1 segregation/condensation protein A [Candidatus Aminicenantes bacterium]MBU1339190.1 segregation/condensation protein A [Acidobacteriota bacterium]MBU1473680.1 segregation/condensation protein A [Acidobacteriota bacterium]MBU4253966.1 segregation/condensation protein A [Acidobacteriota bacterium]
METVQSYQVNLDVFQGPMDLLLFLIRKKKIDIHDIPIAVITGEYLNYLEDTDKINPAREADFLVVAALLIYIKSQMLLPRETVSDGADDPRRLLVDRLVEYQKIKAASSLLKEMELEEIQKWKRTSPPVFTKEESEEFDLREISMYDLAEIFFHLLQRRENENVHVISGKTFSVEEKIKEILALLKDKGYIEFLEYLDSQPDLEEVLGTFFSLLELIKANLVVAVQENLFEPIKVWLRKGVKA